VDRSFIQKNKADPLSHTNQHEPKQTRFERDVTFEAKPSSVFVLISGIAKTQDLRPKTKVQSHHYSSLNATIGSTRAARRAGK